LYSYIVKRYFYKHIFNISTYGQSKRSMSFTQTKFLSVKTSLVKIMVFLGDQKRLQWKNV